MNHMKFAGLLVGVGVLAGTASAQDLLLNGSFEAGSNPPACTTLNPVSGSTAIQGWTVSGPFNIDWLVVPLPCADYPCPKHGFRYLDLNGSGSQTAPASAVAQSVPLQPGRRYQFSVYAFSNPYQSEIGGTKILRISIGGVARDFPLVTSNIPSECPLPLWQECVVQFTAEQVMTVVELRSMFENNAGGIHVDSASLVELICAGDADLSGTVNGVDLAIVLQNWGIPSPKYPRSDVNGDGMVDGIDLGIVLSNWGACP